MPTRRDMKCLQQSEKQSKAFGFAFQSEGLSQSRSGGGDCTTVQIPIEERQTWLILVRNDADVNNHRLQASYCFLIVTFVPPAGVRCP